MQIHESTYALQNEYDISKQGLSFLMPLNLCFSAYHIYCYIILCLTYFVLFLIRCYLS